MSICAKAPQRLRLNVNQIKQTQGKDKKTENLPAVLKHELLPVSLSLAEMNGTLRTGNKAILAEVLTDHIECPQAIQLYETSSCLIIDGQTSWKCR